MTRDDPAYWRKRAKEAREIAAMMEDPEDRRFLQNIATGYDRLAGYADLLAADVRTLPMRDAAEVSDAKAGATDHLSADLPRHH